MHKIEDSIHAIDWPALTRQMNDKGYALVPGLLDAATCAALTADYGKETLYRKTISMARYRFGLGEYKYFRYPLPDLIQSIRQEIYPYLAPIANQWMQALQLVQRFPDTLEHLQVQCREHKQDLPAVLILKYGPGGHNTLHQDLYGEVYFPVQLVLFLSEPGEDYTGGQFVLTEQVPRAQSKAIVLQPRKGDMLLFTTSFRPARGSRGYYRAHMKHGVSEVQEGERHTLGIIFHDATS